MLKRSITFEDLDGNEVTEDFYFNLSKAELVQMELTSKDAGGFGAELQKIVKEQNGEKIVEHFKRIILASYGERSADNRRFIKSQELRDAFEQTDAFSVLFVELATEAGVAAEFINGIVPASMAEEVSKEVAQVKATAGITADTELPTVAPELETDVDPRPKWLQEDREPTKKEMQKMDREELLLAMQYKEDRKSKAS